MPVKNAVFGRFNQNGRHVTRTAAAPDINHGVNLRGVCITAPDPEGGLLVVLFNQHGQPAADQRLGKGIQEFTLAAMESETVAYKMSDWFNGRFKKSIQGKKVYIAREDLSSEVDEKALAKLENNLSLHLVPSTESDWQYVNQSPETVVGYVIAPVFPSKGSVCYKLLFEADTHRLCYLERHKISEKKGEGFLASELKPLGK